MEKKNESENEKSIIAAKRIKKAVYEVGKNVASLLQLSESRKMVQ